MAGKIFLQVMDGKVVRTNTIALGRGKIGSRTPSGRIPAASSFLKHIQESSYKFCVSFLTYILHSKEDLLEGEGVYSIVCNVFAKAYFTLDSHSAFSYDFNAEISDFLSLANCIMDAASNGTAQPRIARKAFMVCRICIHIAQKSRGLGCRFHGPRAYRITREFHW